eukprot:1921389-Rhodomonas_salina.1
MTMTKMMQRQAMQTRRRQHTRQLAACIPFRGGGQREAGAATRAQRAPTGSGPRKAPPALLLYSRTQHASVSGRDPSLPGACALR